MCTTVPVWQQRLNHHTRGDQISAPGAARPLATRSHEQRGRYFYSESEAIGSPRLLEPSVGEMSVALGDGRGALANFDEIATLVAGARAAAALLIACSALQLSALCILPKPRGAARVFAPHFV